MNKSSKQYIHYRFWNYYSNGKNFDKIREDVIKKAMAPYKKNKKTNKEIETLNKRFNSLWDGLKSAQNTIDYKKSMGILQKAIDIIINNFNKKNAAIVGNGIGGTSKIGLTYIEKPVEKLSEKVDHEVSTIKKHLDYLKKLIESAPASETKNELLEKLKTIEKQFIDLVGNNSDNNKLRFHSKYLTNDSQYKQFVADYNNIVNEVFVDNKEVQGLIGEVLTGILLYGYYHGAEMGVNDILNDFTKTVEKIVVGGNVSKKGFTLEMSEKEALQIFGADKEYKTIGKNKVVVLNKNPSQNKVDVTLNIPNPVAGLGIGSKLNATVKNYRLPSSNKQIHLVDGTSIGVLVEGYSNFMYHYMNVTAAHRDIDDQTNNEINDNLKLFHDTMKQLLTINALGGGQYYLADQGQKLQQNDYASILIVNDVYGRGFKIMHISDIIAKVQQNIEDSIELSEKWNEKLQDGSKVEITGYPKNFAYRYGSNEASLSSHWKKISKFSSGQARIQAILKDLYSRKIRLSIKANFLGENYFKPNKT